MHVKVSWRRSIQSSPCPRGTLILLFNTVQRCSILFKLYFNTVHLHSIQISGIPEMVWRDSSKKADGSWGRIPALPYDELPKHSYYKGHMHCHMMLPNHSYYICQCKGHMQCHMILPYHSYCILQCKGNAKISNLFKRRWVMLHYQGH